MTQKGSYQFEKLESREREAIFLAERSHLRIEGFDDLLIRHGLATQGRVLEVGCAQGIRSRLIAAQSRQLQVIGIDRSDELLNLAHLQSRGIENLSFQKADLYELGFADASFDFIYARLVFMHLSEPLRALKSLKRVLKPGGRILIEDADRDCMFFEPEPPSFSDFWSKVQAGQRALGGDPNIGRKLASYFKESGFEQIKIETQPILGEGKEIEFLVRTLMPSLNKYLDPADRAKGAEAIEDLYQLAQDPRAHFYHFWFVVSACQSS